MQPSHQTRDDQQRTVMVVWVSVLVVNLDGAEHGMTKAQVESVLGIVAVCDMNE